MRIDRQFLAWESPLLPQAARWLVDRASREFGPVDLSGVVCVVPVAAAVRRLRELLVQCSDGAVLLPDIITPAELPERLYQTKKPFASPFTQRMAWRHALLETPPDVLKNFLPNAPRKNSFREWLALADLLARQHRELAADALDFQAVAVEGPKLARFPEKQRWLALGDIERRYLLILDDHELWDRQEARLYAISHDECRSARQIVLVGASDLNLIVRKMLDQVVAKEADFFEERIHAGRVTSLIHAPDDQAEVFDVYGCLNVEHWQTRRVPLSNEQVEFAASREDEVAAVGLAVADLANDFAASDIVVGCPDERGVPGLRRCLESAGGTTRHAVGRPLIRSRVGQLTVLIAAHLERATTKTTLDLLKHPDVVALLDEADQYEVIPQLDAFRTQRYPRTLSAETIESTVSASELTAAAAGVRLIDNLLEPITSSAKRTVGSWARTLTQILSRVFGNPATEETEETNFALNRLASLTESLERCPAELNVRVASSDALRIIIGELSDQTGKPEEALNAVTLTGWLELPLDDRPAVVLTSFNDGVIPTSVTSDLFLPGTLRDHLGLNDNARRYARDAYALTVLLHSSQDVRIVVPQTDAEGNPLSPSRLLFTGTPEDTVETFERLLGTPSSRPCLVSDFSPGSATWAVPVPPVSNSAIAAIRPPVTLRVTAFRDYLACPYRFYLKHILRLRTVEPIADELSAAAFGSLVHTVLSRFGRDLVKDSRDADTIRDFVVGELQSHAKAMFGTRPLAAIRVQIQKARQRLERFAEVQAGHRAAGWNISFAESDDESADTRADLLKCDFTDSEGVSCGLTGRIDRVDRHDDGRWLILDYKTSDSAKKPAGAHLRGPKSSPEWVDLQLPMYRHLARGLGVDSDAVTGYFNLPQSEANCGVAMAGFSDDLLINADELAREILANVRRGEFHRREARVPFDDFHAICQSEVLAVAGADGILQEMSIGDADHATEGGGR